MPSRPQPRNPTPDVILRQVVVEEHEISPDGRFAVVVRRFVAANDYRSHLWYVPLVPGAGRLRRLTSGAVRDTRPRVSPDGARLAFRRRRRGSGDDTDSQRLLVLDIAGGDAQAIGPTGPKAAVGDLAWSPAGDRIAYTDEAGPPRFIVGTRVVDGTGVRRAVKATAASAGDTPTARRITRIDWRWDEIGHMDRWEQLFVVAARKGARPRQLTGGDHGVTGGIAWRPDGLEIAFVADRGPEPDLRPRTSIWAVPASPAASAAGPGAAGPGGSGPGAASPPGDEPHPEPREVLALGGSATAPAWSPDGRWIAASGQADPEPLDDVSPGLFVGPADGSSGPVALAPDLDRPIGPWQDTDLNGWMTNSRGGPAWADDRTLIALVTDRGQSVPWRFPVDPGTGHPAGPPERLLTAGSACWTLGVARAAADRGATISVVGTLDGRAMELMTVEGTGDTACYRTHTTLGSAWQAGFIQPVMRRLSAPGPGGPIDVWLASPSGAGDAALPTVVDIHGGPLGAWSPAPAIEVALLTAHGYRVILPNIRGSASYGGAWIRPQLGDWGGVDAADAHAAIDHVVALGLADPARLGALGLSYGGFIVNWMVGTTTRFAAAVSENGVTNQINDWANSDSGPEYSRAALLGDPLTEDGVLKLWRQSPLRHVTSVRTPLLIFQAEADLRCPAADNEQFFIALRTLRREVEYVLYPEEYHTFAVTGRPDRRVDRMTRMLDWFDRHLGGSDA